MVRLDFQEFLIVLSRRLILTLLVGDHAQDKHGGGVALSLQYAVTNILRLL